jgi:hypothetical protein
MRIRAEETKVFKVATTPEEALKAIQVFDDALSQVEHPHKEEQPFQLMIKKLKE